MVHRLLPKGTSGREAQERGNRAPTQVWMVHRNKSFPYVRTAEEDKVALAFNEASVETAADGSLVTLTRYEAKRLAQCLNSLLEETKKR